MDSVWRHLTYAWRVLSRTPGFSLTVVVTLALAIGGIGAVMTAIDAVLLRPLDFPDAQQLVRIREVSEEETTIAPVRLREWRERSDTLDSLTGYFIEDVADATADLPERIRAAAVADDFLETWRVAPAMGRAFDAADFATGAPAVAVISERYWRHRMAAAPDVLGRLVRLDGRSVAVVGVMPATFRFPERDVDIWRPAVVDAQAAHDRELRWFVGIGRLKPGVGIDQARADLARVQQGLAARFPATDGAMGFSMVALKDVVVGGARSSLWLLFAGVAVLLLIASTNVSAMLLTRVAQRERQIAVRFALGASRRSIATQLLTETAVLAGAGALLGLLVAFGALTALRLLAPGLARLEEAAFDARMIAYVVAVAVAVALLCGVLPALRSARLGRALASSARAPLASRPRLQWLLVGVQVTLSVVLLAGAGLLLRSYATLSRVDPGFDPSGTLVFRVSGTWAEENDRARLVQRIDGTLRELSAMPGVESAATAWQLPGVPTRYEIAFAVDGLVQGSDSAVNAEWRTVAPSYFDVTRIALQAGAACKATAASTSREVMVNSAFVSRYLAGRSPVGLNLSWEGASQTGRIAGVVGDARERGLAQAPVPTVYVCDSTPTPFPWFLVRTAGDPHAAIDTIRRKLQEIEPARTVYAIAPLTARIGDAHAQDRLRAGVLLLFAATALGLTCLGIYGTLSHVVNLRRREVGLRMALGARPSSTVRQFVGQALRAVGIACAIGIVGSLAFSWSLSGLLYGIAPWDPLTFVAVVAVVLAVAVAAAWQPARRAARLDPLQALRED